MDYTHNNNTSIGDAESYMTPVTLSLGLVLATVLTVAYKSYASKVDKRSPEFATDTVPLFGAFNFYAKPW